MGGFVLMLFYIIEIASLHGTPHPVHLGNLTTLINLARLPLLILSYLLFDLVCISTHTPHYRRVATLRQQIKMCFWRIFQPVCSLRQFGFSWREKTCRLIRLITRLHNYAINLLCLLLIILIWRYFDRILPNLLLKFIMILHQLILWSYNFDIFWLLSYHMTLIFLTLNLTFRQHINLFNLISFSHCLSWSISFLLNQLGLDGLFRFWTLW